MTIARTLSISALLLASLALLAAGCGGSSSSSKSIAATTGTAAPVLPVQASPIRNASKAPGLRIVSVLVENNVDSATGKDAADHLEIQLANTGKSPLRGLEVYYELTDRKTGDHEAYYAKLGALSVAPGAKASVNFDDVNAAGHYPDNRYSLYHSSKNALDIKVTVSARGAAVQTASVKKDAGGAENPGE